MQCSPQTLEHASSVSNHVDASLPAMAPALPGRVVHESCASANTLRACVCSLAQKREEKMTATLEKLTDEMITELDKGQDAPAAGA